MTVRIGIDLGGTKTEIVALDKEGRELQRMRRSTPSDNYEDIIANMVEMTRKVEADLGLTATVGIGTPGAISPASGLMKNSNTVVLNGKPLRQDLEHALGRPVRIANDANCFALSEAVDGAGAGSEVVFGVIVGTGTGAGVVVRKRVLQGRNAIAGEWGHNPLPWPQLAELPGPACYCGRQGCIETYLSGPGMARDHLQETGQQLSSEAIVAGSEIGDKDCEATLRRYEDRMARSLAHVINVLDPDVIVLGGGMGNIGRLYENVPRLWEQYVFSDSVSTQLVPPVYGDSSGVRGAAWLWGEL